MWKKKMIKYKEMTWFSGKTFGTIYEVQGSNPYLHPFFYIQFYLFILLGFSYVSRAEPNRTDWTRPNDWTWLDRTGPDQNRNLTRPGPEPNESGIPNPNQTCQTVSKKLFQVVHPGSASKHFSHEHPFEQFKLDDLPLHTLKYEVMDFWSAYII